MADGYVRYMGMRVCMYAVSAAGASRPALATGATLSQPLLPPSTPPEPTTNPICEEQSCGVSLAWTAPNSVDAGRLEATRWFVWALLDGQPPLVLVANVTEPVAEVELSPPPALAAFAVRERAEQPVCTAVSSCCPNSR